MKKNNLFLVLFLVLSFIACSQQAAVYNISTVTVLPDFPFSISFQETLNTLLITVPTKGSVLSYSFQSNTTSRVVGSGYNGKGGDGGLAIVASLNTPNGVSFGENGDFFIGDTYNNVIRKVFGNGTIIKFAGTGSFGYSGDGGLSTLANLHSPNEGWFDKKTNSFIFADFANCAVRKVDANGTITTIAGTGTCGYNGDDMLATKATLSYPRSVVMNSIGEVFIADTTNNRIRKVSLDGMISTVAGNGKQGFGGDGGIRMISNDGIIRTIAGNGDKSSDADGGSATLASLKHPVSVTYSLEFGILVSDYEGQAIRRLFCVSECNNCSLLNNCNNRGDCLSNRTCSCQDGYYTSDCSIRGLEIVFNQNNQLEFTNTALTVLTFSKLSGNEVKAMKIETGNNQINILSGVLSVPNLEGYYLSSSVNSANLFTNIQNLMIQDSNSTFVQAQLSTPIGYTFNNLTLDQSNYRYTCLRYDWNAKNWTEDSVSTQISKPDRRIVCSTNHVTSVFVRSESSPSANTSITATSIRLNGADNYYQTNIILLVLLFLLACY